jgi:hypothetical protein
MATEKNFQATTPAAPSGARNSIWQVSGTPSGTDPATGQLVFPSSCYQTDMVGDTGSGGQDGLVPAPPAGSAAAGNFLKADGTWAVPPGGGGGTFGGDLATVTGTTQKVIGFNQIPLDTAITLTDGMTWQYNAGTNEWVPVFDRATRPVSAVVGKPAAGQLVLIYTAEATETFPANFTGPQSYGSVGTNPTATAVYSIFKNATNVGTVSVSTSGVFTFATTGGVGFSLNAGDRLTMVAPGSQDATLSDVGITLVGTRGSVSNAVTPPPIFTWLGAYSGTTTYNPFDVVSFSGSSYVCIAATTGNDPTHTAFWSLMAQAGANGAGTVNSVALTTPGEFNVSGSPITSSGTLAITKANQNANLVYAGPSSGSAAAPTFRSIAAADLPLGSSSAFGAVKVDGTTITASAGVISAAAAGNPGLFSGLIGSSVPSTTGTGLTTAFNQRGSFSVTNSAIGISMVDTTGTGTENIEGIVKTYPGVAYTLTVCMSVPIFASNFNLIGIIAATSTSGKLMLFGIRWNGGFQLGVLAYNAFNSFNSNPGTYTSYAVMPYIWLRLKDDGTNITFYISNDGVYFNQFYTVTKASSFLGGSGFGLLGIAIDPCNGVIGSSCMAYDYTTP